MKVTLLSAAALSVALFTANVAQADMPPQPERCPGVSAIQSVGLELVEQENDGSWAAGVMSNKYDTNDNWTFAIGQITASDADDAQAKATESLKTLTLQQGPIPMTDYEVWACLYRNAKGYFSVSVTPAFGFNSAVKFVK